VTLTGLPLLGLVGAVAIALLTLYLFLRRIITPRLFLLLEAAAVVGILAAVFPQSIDFVMDFLQIDVRGLFVLAVGLLGGYFLLYVLYVTYARQERKIVRLFQEVALLRYQVEHGHDEGDRIELDGEAAPS